MTENIEEKINQLQREMSDPGFWQDKERAMEVVSLYNQLKAEYEALKSRPAFFKGEYDKNDAILSISAGTGGTEAQDWAEMLFRMYLRFTERKNFQVDILEKSYGTEAGIKSASLLIKGPYAYGWLKSENGVHRLVRISPFDADRARHTSFALVEVIPQIPDPQIEINPEDLKIETFRASGPGGQHLQKTESAVRITHLPTKITVSCQSSRFQQQNKESALKILKSRLYQLKLKEKRKEIEKAQGEVLEASWGNQIRSYVLHPYKLVKDHRTGWQSTNPDAFLDGEIEGAIESYLKSKS